MTIRNASKQNQNPLGVVVLLFLILLSSCDFEDEAPVCKYNTRIIYRYNRENTSAQNVLPTYIHSLTEYLFDERGILYAISTLPGASCFGEYVSETNLPPGKYTVIAWGNKSTQSKVNTEQIGVTTREEMMLCLNTLYAADPTFQSDSERLYYGYTTFSINEFGVSKVIVDMTHSHCVLNITVRWKKESERPAETSSFHMTIRQIPSNYMFMPEFLAIPDKPIQVHTPDIDKFPAQTAEILNYIPQVLWQQALVKHFNTMRMDVAKELRGQFITYRYRNDSHVLLTIYIDGKPLAGKTMDLLTFFKSMQIDLDKTLKQEYDILLEIDGDQITVSLITDIDEDWDDGGEV